MTPAIAFYKMPAGSKTAEVIERMEGIVGSGIAIKDTPANQWLLIAATSQYLLHTALKELQSDGFEADEFWTE